MNEWQGLYFVSSSDSDNEGPFTSLEDALDREYFSGPTSNPSIDCRVLKKARLMEIAHSRVGEDCEGMMINGKWFVLRNGKLIKPRKKGVRS